jgi:hypothetical protein
MDSTTLPGMDSTMPGPMPSQDYIMPTLPIPPPPSQDSIANNFTLPPGDEVPKARDDYTIMTETPYQLRVDYNKNLAMLTKPEIDLKLEAINPNVFDRIQKVVDEINSGYDYIKKTKILMAQLEYYQELRKYETVIRRATNLTVDTEPFSLEKLQERVCTDPWLALFFKKANETRNMKLGKKLTIDTWRMTKQMIIAYYLNFFLFKKKQVSIKNSKLPSFAVNCIRMRPNTKKFNDFCVFELGLHGPGKLPTDPDELVIPDAYLEKNRSYDDDSIRFGEYSDIFNLVDYCDNLYDDDEGNAELKKDLAAAGVSGKGGWSTTVSSIISWIGENQRNIAFTLGAAYLTAELVQAATSQDYKPLIHMGLDLGYKYGSMSIDALANSRLATNISGYGSNLYYGALGGLGIGRADDGATISAPTTKTAPYPGINPVSIGQIKKVGDKYIQSGFFYTLCVFVDEALENCMRTYVAKNGPINWGKPVEQDEALDFKSMMECHKQRHELIQINRLVIDLAEKAKIDSMINDMRRNSYESIRKAIDDQLVVQLQSKIRDEDRSKQNVYNNQNEVNAGKLVAQQWYDALYKKGTAEALMFKKALDRTWTYDNPSRRAAFTDGASRPHVWKDGSSARSPKRQRDGYKRSPEYDGLKKAYKTGRITKDAFKDGKKVLKSRKR